MGRRYDLQSLKTKQDIFNTACELFLENGYYNTSLKDIAEAAGIPVSTLYKYYPAKGDLLLQIGILSISRLRKFAADLPDTMTVKEKILAVMINDLAGVQSSLKVKEKTQEKNIMHRAEIVRVYWSEMYKNKERLGIENQTRLGLANIYRAILEDERERGAIAADVDLQTLSSIISAIYFYELSFGLYNDTYPYLDQFSHKLDILFKKLVIE